MKSKFIRKIKMYFCKHNYIGSEFYNYPPDMYVEYTCEKCGHKKYQDL